MKQSRAILAALVGLFVLAASTQTLADGAQDKSNELHFNGAKPEQEPTGGVEPSTPGNRRQNPLDNSINNRINTDQLNLDVPDIDQGGQQQEQPGSRRRQQGQQNTPSFGSILPSFFGGFGRMGGSDIFGGSDSFGGSGGFGRSNSLFDSPSPRQKSQPNRPFIFDPLNLNDAFVMPFQPFGRSDNMLDHMEQLASEFEKNMNDFQSRPGESRRQRLFMKNGVGYKEVCVTTRYNPNESNQVVIPDNKRIDQQQQLPEQQQQQQPPQQQPQQQPQPKQQ